MSANNSLRSNLSLPTSLSLQRASHRYEVRGVLMAAVLVLAFGTATAQDSLATREPAPIQAPAAGAEVTERLGERVPAEQIQLVDHDGKPVTLADYLEMGRPVILNMGYFDCPKLCGLVTNGLMAGMKQTSWTPGKEYTVLTVSLDPAEGHDLAAEKRRNYLEKFDRPGAEEGWFFLTGSEEHVKLLAESTGFGFVWDERGQQYIHAAAVVVLSPGGTVTRYLYGIQYPELQLRNALYEAADGKVGSTLDKIVLYCYDFDPTSNSYVPVAINIMKLGGLVTMLGLGIFLGLFWFRERRTKRTSQQPT